jgi:hypothetical protein
MGLSLTRVISVLKNNCSPCIQRLPQLRKLVLIHALLTRKDGGTDLISGWVDRVTLIGVFTWVNMNSTVF